MTPRSACSLTLLSWSYTESGERQRVHTNTIMIFSDLRDSDLFPDRFVDETLRTLSLLLLSNDKKSISWFRFRKEQRRNLNDEFIDGGVIKCRPLKMKERQIGNFEFWHNRLVMLKQAFDEADPKTVRQYVMVVASIFIKKANFEIL